SAGPSPPMCETWVSQPPGKTLSRTRPSTSRQYQLLDTFSVPSRLNQPIAMPMATGTTTAHRNGLLRAQAEHSINQPTVGSAHNRYNGIEPTRFIITCNGCDSVSRCHTPTPCSESVSANSISIRMPVTVPTTTAMNGATTVAAMTLESTVAASETGSDFQNRMLRSRRSSYNAPRQQKNTTKPITMLMIMLGEYI